MLGAIYTGLSGMNAYAKGLTVISNNVANLNTAGFKVSVPLFSDVVFRSGTGAVNGAAGTVSNGAGVDVNTSQLSFRQGELRDTGNSLDVAIDGNGFFVLEQDGKNIYTRAGQFEFDKDGFLVERGTGAKVMLRSEDAAIGAFKIDPLRVFEPRITSQVDIAGTLARGGTQTTFELPNVSVVDTVGGDQTLKVRFVRDPDDASHWTVEAVDAQNAVLGQGELRFNDNGTPAEGANSISVTVDPEDSAAFDIVLHFGAAGSFSGTTSVTGSTTSNLQVLKHNGVKLGSLTQFAFDEGGRLKFTYSNGEKRTVGTLVLAQFDAPDELQALGGALFAAIGDQGPKLGAGMSEGFGRAVGGRIELSNVELTEQFTDLIIIQRGYQASSQMASVANELIQQLLAMDNRR